MRSKICILSLALMALAVNLTQGRAEDAPRQCSGNLTADQILNCLNPASATRSLFPTKKGIAVEGRDTADVTASVNLIVNFEFDSARLTNDGIISLDALGKALADPSLKKARFQIAGHTDAVGSDQYNQLLSEQRANAVRDYLVDRHGMDPATLVTIGYGKTKLYDPNNPKAAINRRVQITRLGDQAAGQ